MPDLDPKRPIQTCSGLVVTAFVVVLLMFVIVKVLEAIWVPLVIIGGIVVLIAAATWFAVLRLRRW